MSLDPMKLLSSKLAKLPGVTSVHLKISDRCNHACSHCYEVQGEKGELSSDEVRSLLDRLAKSGVFLLTIGGGEATLRKDCYDLIAYARTLNFAVRLFTNGYTIDDAEADKISEMGVWEVHISLYGADAETHETVTKVPGSFERTIRAIRLLTDRKVRTLMKVSLMRHNFSQMESLEKMAHTLGATISMASSLMNREDGNDSPLDLSMTADQIREFEKKYSGSRAYSKLSIEKHKGWHSCKIGDSTIAIQSNGEIRACVGLHVGFGNAFTDSLHELYEAENLKFLRSLTVGDLHGCRDCDLAEGCSRCHGSALLETGDMLGPYVSGCRMAIHAYEANLDTHVQILPLDQEGTRPLQLGPFRIVNQSTIAQIQDDLKDEDWARYKKFPWLRTDTQEIHRQLSSPQGEPLVQLRKKTNQKTSISGNSRA